MAVRGPEGSAHASTPEAPKVSAPRKMCSRVAPDHGRAERASTRAPQKGHAGSLDRTWRRHASHGWSALTGPRHGDVALRRRHTNGET